MSCTDPGEDDYDRVLAERSFSGIHSSGFTPPQSSPANPDACNSVGADGQMRVRFVLTDNNGKPIRLGEAVNRQSVDPGADAIAFNHSALMEASVDSCTSDDVCDGDFTCEVAPGLQNGAASQACLRPDNGFAATEGPDALDFVADINEHQVYGLLMEHSGSLTGWNPPGSEGAWDKNADGDVSDPEDAAAQQGRLGNPIATDFRGERLRALVPTQASWAKASQLAESEERETYFGLWSFNETRVEPTSHVAPTSPGGVQWADELDGVGRAIGDLEQLDEAERVRANVYESIENLITNEYSTQAMQNLGLDRPEAVDKQLVVFVDGYDELRENDGVKIDGVIETATANNVRLFIVHLDPKMDEPGELRDDPMYPSGQNACVDDSDCKNYEACTQPRGFDADGDGDVELPNGANYDLSETYCIPRRDEFGRTGPIDDYARLACATGGGYMYVSSAGAIADNVSWTPLALEGLWEAKVVSSSINRGDVPTGAPLRVHSAMSVTIAGQSQLYQFSQLGDLSTGAGGAMSGLDNRGVVFTTP